VASRFTRDGLACSGPRAFPQTSDAATKLLLAAGLDDSSLHLTLARLNAPPSTTVLLSAIVQNHREAGLELLDQASADWEPASRRALSLAAAGARNGDLVDIALAKAAWS
jgi:hypothetical protein